MSIPRRGRPPIKGRGALSQPPGRFESETAESVDDGWTAPEDPLASRATSCEPERAKSIITTNDSPDIPFERSINPYRGCEHGCIYCLSPDTEILMGDGSVRALGALRVGDEIYGTTRVGHSRRYVRTRVLAHWRSVKPAYRVELGDGTELEASRDHRFLTERGWKFVAPAHRAGRRPCLMPSNSLMGFGKLGRLPGGMGAAVPRAASAEYARGYLCGTVHLALMDADALIRTRQFLAGFGVGAERFTVWPESPHGEVARGFLAGAFDAEGSYSDGILRIVNTNLRYIGMLVTALRSFEFQCVVETRTTARKPVHVVRVRGGLREHLRFFRLVEPAIARKGRIDSLAVKSAADLSVAAVVPLGVRREFYDITTGTGNFIANGVVSHNCYARPAHSYIGLSPGLDFETKLFYKADAARLLEAELGRRSYVCKPITLGANTDPYQPVERRLRVTRSLLEVFVRHRHPVTVITKGVLIERDLDLLADLARDRLAAVMLSLPTLQESLKRTLEPRAAAPQARLRAMRALHAAGVPVGVLVAPVIPAVTDHELEAILEACRDAGAVTAGYVLLRLPFEVKELFREWLAAHLPDRAAHVMSLVQQQRGGRDNDAEFGTRMRGTGPLATLLERRFELACRRLGLNAGGRAKLDTSRFEPPRPATPQLDLGL